MQLFSIDQQRSQALEAHAAAFAQFKVSKFSHLTRSLPFSLPFSPHAFPLMLTQCEDEPALCTI